jgi:hypothetical protein
MTAHNQSGQFGFGIAIIDAANVRCEIRASKLSNRASETDQAGTWYGRPHRLGKLMGR